MKIKLKEINKILPFSAVTAVIGTFFTVFSIIYILTQNFVCDGNLLITLYIIEGLIAIISMMVALIIIAYRNHKRYSQMRYVQCKECLNKQIEDGFHQAELVDFNELLQVEGRLAYDSNPQECCVFVYTSDLATEKNAEIAAEVNRNKGVVYKILYFNNSCTEQETLDLEARYGKENLRDLSKYKCFVDTFDYSLANTLAFDIMIYRNSSGKMEGYFAVDFVVVKDDCPIGHNNHRPDCQECCNYMKYIIAKNKDNKEIIQEPFYKKIAYEKTETLYRQINAIFNEA